MTLDDVITLAKAGYTKEEIARFSLTNTSAAKDKSEAPKAQNEAPAAAATKTEPEKKEAPAPAAPAAETPTGSDPFAAFNEAAEKALAAFTEKLDKFTTLAGMPSISNVVPKGVEDIISGFLKEV